MSQPPSTAAHARSSGRSGAQSATEAAPCRTGRLQGRRLEFAFDQNNGARMNVHDEVLRVLDEVLSLNGRSAAFTRETPLLGAIPELDSMAVVTLITTLEEQLGIAVDDDEIDGDTFATVGSLVDFAGAKLAA